MRPKSYQEFKTLFDRPLMPNDGCRFLGKVQFSPGWTTWAPLQLKLHLLQKSKDDNWNYLHAQNNWPIEDRMQQSLSTQVEMTFCKGPLSICRMKCGKKKNPPGSKAQKNKTCWTISRSLMAIVQNTWLAFPLELRQDSFPMNDREQATSTKASISKP